MMRKVGGRGGALEIMNRFIGFSKEAAVDSLPLQTKWCSDIHIWICTLKHTISYYCYVLTQFTIVHCCEVLSGELTGVKGLVLISVCMYR